jgi:hypothetical protein
MVDLEDALTKFESALKNVSGLIDLITQIAPDLDWQCEQYMCTARFGLYSINVMHLPFQQGVPNSSYNILIKRGKGHILALNSGSDKIANLYNYLKDQDKKSNL